MKYPVVLLTMSINQFLCKLYRYTKTPSNVVTVGIFGRTTLPLHFKWKACHLTCKLTDSRFVTEIGHIGVPFLVPSQSKVSMRQTNMSLLSSNLIMGTCAIRSAKRFPISCLVSNNDMQCTIKESVTVAKSTQRAANNVGIRRRKKCALDA